MAKVTGYMSWAHKTAPELILGPAAEKLRQYDRKGFHAQLPLLSKENPRLRAYVENCNVSASIKIERPEEERQLEPVQRTGSRCHPERPRINPAGDCLECALAKQARRVR